MGSTTSFLVVVFGYLAFGILAVIWISKKKKAGEKISLWAKIIIATIFLSSSSVLLSMIELSPVPSVPLGSVAYYVKTGSANVRECPSTSCKIIDSLPQNEKLVFPGNLFDKHPEWAEITFPNGQIGYVSKTTLSENPVSERPLTPTDDSSSMGGIIIGPWANIQVTVGESYEFHFCEPPSAISGATCGGLADAATNPKGGRPPYSFIKKSGFLPPGMALELNGTLKGSPTQEGTYKYRLCAKDLYGGEGCQNLAVVVTKKGENSPVNGGTAESADLDITTDSMACKLAYQDFGYSKFDVSMSGTATGPIGTYLSVGASDPDDRYIYYMVFLDGSRLEVNANSWTEQYRTERGYSNRRAQKDPAITSWDLHIRTSNYAGDSRMARIHLVLMGGGGEKRIFKDIPCSP